MNFTIEAAFNIDDGELDGEKPEAVFVLGVEYGQVFALAKQPQAFSTLIHEENKDRVECLLVTKRRSFWTKTDGFGFVQFNVRGLD